jgi:hypothetical protein
MILKNYLIIGNNWLKKLVENLNFQMRVLVLIKAQGSWLISPLNQLLSSQKLIHLMNQNGLNFHPDITIRKLKKNGNNNMSIHLHLDKNNHRN